MIKVKHPVESYNIHQEIFLKNASEEDKEYHSLAFSFKNSVYLYYSMQLDATSEVYQDWLEEMTDDELKNTMQAKGFEACKKALSFNRYLRKLRIMDEQSFICKKMGKEQYDRYKILMKEKTYSH
ncbi:hypothetical protein MKJ01_18175 [Chryseobacterium sp. SSA4.19]|uniref:hypothetical protein n=1 Tax=Chryseobacterium sp. SSA4.19 TaxID=2919915 RepID=UPI001F4D8EB0|nr:hypothetical protein [Chryseobacterium sp. SSA4.19]MCJ8155685.1 hypothetical protein [Chryseobacterium sp. SSA4.19]